ncbi:hypothetical protein CLAIMM_06157 [Cladophialophora immunda]|nr:hypothetical protein CLAIMM_06157 [Cladophialophora immunda]
MLCRNCSNVRFQWFEEIAEASAYAQNPNNSVFETCRKYDISSVEQKFYVHHADFQHLAQSKDAGCYFCAALWFAFNEPSSDPEQGKIDSVSAGEESPLSPAHLAQADSPEPSSITRTCPVVWRVFASRRAEFASNMWFDVESFVYVFCGKFFRTLQRVQVPEGAFARLTSRIYELWESKQLLEIDNSTQSNDTFELARLWYNNCLSNHPSCATLSFTTEAIPPLPTRVIDVREDGMEPVLYEPGHGETGEYICLSHCWGGTKPLDVIRHTGSGQSPETGRSNVFQLPQLATWPKTFRDAVDIARKFHIRYLWIDNTSIIQKDKDDWAKESQRMAQYFGNATFTIAAAWASNDDLGLYHSQNPLLTYPLCLFNPSDVPPCKGYYVSLMGLNSRDKYEVINTPLAKRAWVLQEEQLSRRRLTYGAKGVYWLCFCCSASLDNIMGSEVTPYRHERFGDNQQLRMHIHPSLSGAPADAGRNPYLHLWYAQVEQFTSRNMKMKSDVLPALSGFAQAFSSYMETGDQYAAGLWQSDLMLGLLWTTDLWNTRGVKVPGGATNFDPEGFSGPSWSWICQCHKRIYFHFREKMLPGGRCDYRKNTALVGTKITRVEIDHQPFSGPYGEVKGGRLFVTAKLLSVLISTTPHTLTNEDKTRRNMIGGHGSIVYLLSVDTTPFPWLARRGIWCERGREFKGECDVDDMFDEACRWFDPLSDVEAKFLPLIMYEGDPDGLRTAGLVLVPSGNKEDEFVRVGRAEVDMPNFQTLQRSTLPAREITIV